MTPMEKHQSEPLSPQEQMRILTGLIPKKRRIILALMLDVIACFVVIFFVLVLYLTMFKTSVPVILGMSLVFASPIIFQEPFLIVTGGTFGMFLTQIAYVDGSSGLRFNHFMFWKYTLTIRLEQYKYSEIYEIYRFFSNELCQTVKMESTHTYFVRVGAYNVLFDKGVVPFRND